MILVTFRRGGEVGFGAASDDGVIDLGARLGGRYSCLREALHPEGIDDLRRAAEGRAADFAFADIELLPPVPNPRKIICIGVNYETHRQETGRERAQYPTIFTRFADTLVGHGAAIVKPRVSDKLDYEGELAVIIGAGGRDIAEADAQAHIAGYACFNDASVRDWQRHSHQFVPGKNFPRTGGFGPWITTADEIANIEERAISTRLNGEVMQDARISQLIFKIPELIHYISTFTPLSPGDVICTGTPGGVGARRDPPLFMKPGDEVVVEIEGVGRLMNRIEAEA